MRAVLPNVICVQFVIAQIVDPPGILEYEWTSEAFILLALSGFSAFFVLFSGFLVVGNNGALTSTLLSPGKSAVAMVGTYFLYDTHYSAIQVMAASGSLVSLAMYTHVTIQEKEHQAQTYEYNPVSTDAGLDEFLDKGDELDDETSRTTESDMDLRNNDMKFAIV
jgi:hypothetical protein